MSTVRQHLGLLWIERRTLGLSNPQFDRHWAAQAALFVETHLEELIALAGGADLEEWAGERYAPIPADFPRTASTDAASRGGAQGRITQASGNGAVTNYGSPVDNSVDVEAERKLFEAWARGQCDMPPGVAVNWDAQWVNDTWSAWLAARTQADAGKDAARLNALIEWYRRGGARSEINPSGHIAATTREQVIAWCDAQTASPTTNPENT